MRTFKPILLLFILFFSQCSYAAVNSNAVTPATVDLSKIKAKDIEKTTGKKLSFLQKMELRLLQKKLKKFRGGAITEKQKQQAQLSMILGISSLAVLLLSGLLPFIGLLCVPAAIIAIIFGAKSLKGNSNTQGIVGVVTGGITLAILLLAIIVLALFFASFGIE